MSKKTKGFIQLICVIAFIVGSFVISGMMNLAKSPVSQKEKENRSLYVESEYITPAPYRITFETTGTIEARTIVAVVPQVSGNVISVNENFYEGGVFEPDTVLFKIDSRDFELNLNTLKAKVAQAKTALELQGAQAQAALSEWRMLNGDKEVPELVARKPQLAEARATLQGAKAELENARLDLERSTFSLPFRGRVMNTDLSEGQYVTAGQTYGQVFELDTLEIKASLEDQQLEWLLETEDPDISIHTTYLGREKEFKGFVKRGAASLDPQTRFATVSFGIEGAKNDLLPGLLVTLKIQGKQRNNIAVLPSSALQKDGIVWLVTNNETLEKFIPNIIYSDESSFAIDNLSNAQRVVTSRISGGTEGTRVLLNGNSNDKKEQVKNEPHEEENETDEAPTHPSEIETPITPPSPENDDMPDAQPLLSPSDDETPENMNNGE